jgi:hypothetical protein
MYVNDSKCIKCVNVSKLHHASEAEVASKSVAASRKSCESGAATLLFFNFFPFHTPPSPLEFFFDFFLARFWEGKKRWEGREKENEGTDDVS